jgi:hypothetical protein
MGSPICEGARLGTIVTKHPLGVRKFPLGWRAELAGQVCIPLGPLSWVWPQLEGSRQQSGGQLRVQTPWPLDCAHAGVCLGTPTRSWKVLLEMNSWLAEWSLFFISCRLDRDPSQWMLLSAAFRLSLQPQILLSKAQTGLAVFQGGLSVSQSVRELWSH